MDSFIAPIHRCLHQIVLFLQHNHQGITELATAAPILSAVCSTLALVATVIGVCVGIVTFQRAKKQLESTTVYTMQKDGRELMSNIRNDSNVFNYIFGEPGTPVIAPETEEKGKNCIKSLIQYYSALHTQWDAKIISKRIWLSTQGEISHFFTRKSVRDVWRAAAANYDSSFQQYCNELAGRPSAQRTGKK
jgi:hypothetical protein